MRAVRLKALATELGGRCHGDDAVVSGVAIDSRRVSPGDLFVALPGARVDGHAYVAAAIDNGAAAAMVTEWVDSNLPQWRVDDAQRWLIELACWARAQINAPVIGVTGSNGKTTVKEMLNRILATLGPTQATRGNLNNELGVPVTLCQLSPDDRFAVIEMGCGQPGDIKLLSSWARPHIGVVNNAAAAHLAGFGSVEAIARCKGELFEALPTAGYAVINADDPHAGLWEEQAAHCHIVRFSLAGQSAEVNANLVDEGRLALTFPNFSVTVEQPLPGRHNAYNALAAATAAWAAGADAHAIASGLAAMQPVAGRLHALAGPAGSQIIDDSYNANPASLRAALETHTPTRTPMWLVLGDMAELGEAAVAAHVEAGELARSLGVARVYALGELSAHAANAFGREGRVFADHQALVEQLREDLQPDVRVLVKGSRSAHMDKVVAALAATQSEEDWACC